MSADGCPYLGTVVSCGKIVPLISSEVEGPLGLMHLPRLWLKALLLATDSLAEDWGCGPGGLDKRIMDFVGIDPDVFVPWLMQTFPTYAECEAWVCANARSLNEDTIARSNARLSTHPLPRGLGPKFRNYLGIDDDRVDVGIRLNNFDDWMAVYQYVNRYGFTGGPIVPAISPRTTGLLALPHLPRQWLIVVLRSAQLLPADYRFAYDPGADKVLEGIGIDPVAAAAFIEATRPPYLSYESWLRQHAKIDTTTVERVNDGLDISVAKKVEDHDRDVLHRMLLERRTSVQTARTAGIYAFRADRGK